MNTTDESTHTPATRLIPRPSGRPLIGVRARTQVPIWAMEQIDALVAGEWGGSTRASVVRDLIVFGLIALKRNGVQAPGFDPGTAIRDALGRGEPTSTALDATPLVPMQPNTDAGKARLKAKPTG